MQLGPALIAAVTVTLIGAGILWANPARWVNRSVFFCSLHVAGWLALLHVSITVDKAEGLFWLRCASTFGALLPLHLWAVKETIAIESMGWVRARWRSGAVWLALTAALAVLPFTDYFVPSHSRADARVVGPGYYGYMVSVVLLYVALCHDTFRHSRRLAGSRRVELQIWLLGGSSAAVVVILLMAANAILHDPGLILLQTLVVMLFFGGTVVAITVHRVFDARQLLVVGLQNFTLVCVVALCAFGADAVLRTVVVEPLAFLATTGVSLWFASLLNGWLNRFFQFYPQAFAARQAAYTAARRETRLENLEPAFLSVLKGWGQSDHAIVISGSKESLQGSGVEILGDSTLLRAIRQLRWATPERLSRERPTPAREELGAFLRQHGLGVLVIAEGPTLTALVGVGVGASRRPFTYPQVTQLMELASIIESALERAHFAVKVQHAEQLATVGLLGASLAHEIRNPLVTIKTFVQLLPKHHQDPAFRDKFFRLIGDEVNRIDRLTEQLLDLASPRAYLAEMVELHPLLRASLDLVAAKAADKRIEFRTDFAAAPDLAFTDASAAKQVMLNLCFNAIQALESTDGERWVEISTRNAPGGVEMAVADSGPGIAEEIQARLFQPFQSTKSTGFGLGLAICSDILANLDASITVDPPAPGRGATFRVIFPCQPLSS